MSSDYIISIVVCLVNGAEVKRYIHFRGGISTHMYIFTHKHGSTESSKQQSVVTKTRYFHYHLPPLPSSSPSHPTPSSQQPAEQLRCQS